MNRFNKLMGGGELWFYFLLSYLLTIGMTGAILILIVRMAEGCGS